MQNQTGLRKTVLFASTAFLIVWGLTELMSFVFLEAVVKKTQSVHYRPAVFHLTESQRTDLKRMLRGEEGLIRYDSELGWTTNFPVHINAAANKRPGKTIAVYGDSFVALTEDNASYHWSSFLGNAVTAEISNYGVPGYGFDQAYLRYHLEGKKEKADIVLICFLSENINRNVNVFRPFYIYSTSVPLAKPRFILQQGKLELIENPFHRRRVYKRLLAEEEKTLEELGQNDYFYRKYHRAGWLNYFPSFRLLRLIIDKFSLPVGDTIISGKSYNPSSEAYALMRTLVETFYAEVRESGSEPVVVVFPELWDLEQFKKYGTVKYGHLLDDLRHSGIRIVDLKEAFAGRTEPLRIFYDKSLHFNALGNQVVTGYLSDYLRKFNPAA